MTDSRVANVGEDSQDLEEGAAALEIVDGAEALENESKQEIPSNSDVSSESLLEEILKLHNFMIFQQKVKHEADNVTANNVKEKLNLLQTSKSIGQLYIRAGLTFF